MNRRNGQPLIGRLSQAIAIGMCTYVSSVSIANAGCAPKIATQALECGRVTLISSTAPLSEGIRSYVSTVDQDGHKIFPTVTWNGEIVSLCKQGVYLILETGVHQKPSTSFLVSAERNQILARWDFGEIAAFGLGDRQNVFWIQQRGAENRNPFTRLRVFSSSGKLLLDKSFSRKWVPIP